jgi:hypothetical protein
MGDILWLASLGNLLERLTGEKGLDVFNITMCATALDLMSFNSLIEVRHRHENAPIQTIDVPPIHGQKILKSPVLSSTGNSTSDAPRLLQFLNLLPFDTPR